MTAQRLGALALLTALVACSTTGKDSDSTAPATGTPVGAGTGTGTGTGTGGTTTDCGGDGQTFAVTVTWNDDGLAPQDTDGDGVNDTGCDGDTVDICIGDPLGETAWLFGMAEDGAMGWTGEDCFNGYAGYNHCHPIGPVATLSEVCTLGEVASGQTTLLDAAKDPFLTYYLEDSTGACFVFGTDPAFYASLGCTEMM